MTVQLAMYRGPADDLMHKITHWGVCVFTLSRWSHCEIVVDGVCYSSSVRDGGVRQKKIDLDSGKWDVFDLDGVDAASVLKWFDDHMGEMYDWMGIARFLIPGIKQSPDKWFCSEACAAALGIANPSGISPDDLFSYVVDQLLVDSRHFG